MKVLFILISLFLLSACSYKVTMPNGEIKELKYADYVKYEEILETIEVQSITWKAAC